MIERQCETCQGRQTTFDTKTGDPIPCPDCTTEKDKKGSNKKTLIKATAITLAVLVAAFILIYIATTPPDGVTASKQYIEDHYDALAERGVENNFQGKLPGNRANRGSSRIGSREDRALHLHPGWPVQRRIQSSQAISHRHRCPSPGNTGSKEGAIRPERLPSCCRRIHPQRNGHQFSITGVTPGC